MTLASMPLFSQGVVLAVAPAIYQKVLPTGTHIKIAAKDAGQIIIEAEGKTLMIKAPLAAEIIVIKQVT